MFKSILSIILGGAFALNAFACWFTSETFKNNYIAGVNNYFSHVSDLSDLSGAVYCNGASVDLPITVYVKISPRVTGSPVTVAKLQYKVLPSGSWITVKTFINPSWSLNFDRPVPWFGRYNIAPSGLTANTEILIRLYLSDGIYETGDPDTDITSSVPDTATNSNGGSYEGGWSAPFVMRVKFSGRKRVDF